MQRVGWAGGLGTAKPSQTEACIMIRSETAMWRSAKAKARSDDEAHRHNKTLKKPNGSVAS